VSISEYISFILLAIIGLIFLVDFILNSRKKSIDKSVEKFVEKEKNIRKSSFKWLNWILDRKKNIILFILLTFPIKALFHMILYPEDRLSRPKDTEGIVVNYEYYDAPYSFYFSRLGQYEELYIITIIIMLLLVWFFNDKIKAR